MDWIDNLPNESPEDTRVATGRGMIDSDDAIRNIASRLTPDEAAVFIEAVNQVRNVHGTGKVRMRDPLPEEQPIIEAYQRLMHVGNAAAELGVSKNRVNYVVRKYQLKPLERRYTTLWSRPQYRQFIREKLTEGWSLKDVQLGLGQMIGRKGPAIDTIRRYAEEEGITFRVQGRFDATHIEDLVDDVDYLIRKYNCGLPHLHTIYQRELEKRSG